MVELVYDTIREPKRIVDVPVPIAKLLAAPRERLYKSVGCQACALSHEHACEARGQPRQCRLQ